MAATREQSFAADIGARTREAEERIDAAKRRALADLPVVACEVADSAFRRLTGEAPNPDRATGAAPGALVRSVNVMRGRTPLARDSTGERLNVGLTGRS